MPAVTRARSAAAGSAPAPPPPPPAPIAKSTKRGTKRKASAEEDEVVVAGSSKAAPKSKKRKVAVKKEDAVAGPAPAKSTKGGKKAKVVAAKTAPPVFPGLAVAVPSVAGPSAPAPAAPAPKTTKRATKRKAPIEEEEVSVVAGPASPPPARPSKKAKGKGKRVHFEEAEKAEGSATGSRVLAANESGEKNEAHASSSVPPFSGVREAPPPVATEAAGPIAPNRAGSLQLDMAALSSESELEPYPFILPCSPVEERGGDATVTLYVHDPNPPPPKMYPAECYFPNRMTAPKKPVETYKAADPHWQLNAEKGKVEWVNLEAIDKY